MLTADKIVTVNGVKVQQYLLHSHNPNKITLPPKRTKPLLGVTIHNTIDLANVNDDPEQYTRATVNGNMRTVRVHYYVDDLGAWQNLDNDYCNWTCTDGTGSGNTQTIAIECVMDGTAGTANLAARDNAARLAAYILYSNGLSSDKLYTHTYWLHVRDGHSGTKEQLCVKPHTYKTCPYYIIPDWSGFCSLVKMYYNNLRGSSTTSTTTGLSYKVKILDSCLNVRKAAGTNNPIIATVGKGEVYTIVAEQLVGSVLWGKLKSGVGWISLSPKYVTKI